MTKKIETSNQTPENKIDSNLAEIVPNRRREWRFTLPLPAEVEGRLPDGKAFREKTSLENISSTGAYFGLDAPITVGARLCLIVQLPERLTEGTTIRLRLEGQTVRLQRLMGKPKKQGIALKFDEEFQFVNEGAAE